MTTDREQSSPTYAGHRARLLERYKAAGCEGLHEYEIIELLLTFVLPRQDTKPIARALLTRFKTVGGIINATPEQITDIKGMGERAALLIALCKDIMSRSLRERFAERPLISCRSHVEEYLRFTFGLLGYEYVALFFLDTANRVVACEIMAEGTSNQCQIYPRKVIERAIHFRASSMIMAHNHPGGATTASAADWAITRHLHEAGRLLEIPLVDHLIITRNGVFSLRDMPQWPIAR